jgi:carbamoyltransferase
MLISLGHNSSAIRTGDEVVGYEEERLTRIKSDSTFPVNSLKKLNFSKSDVTYISHWYDNFDFYKESIPDIGNHQYNYLYMGMTNPEIVTLSKNFTHHDAHAYSSLAFLREFSNKNEPFYLIVADGFGNKQEVISIYKTIGTDISLIDRIFDYKHSLGLLYQYATSFVGMKENQDEYKFLGYESHVDDYLSKKEMEDLDKEAYKYISHWIQTIGKHSVLPDEKYINIEELRDSKKYFYDVFNEINKIFKCKSKDSLRSIIGYFVQKVIEEINIYFIQKYGMENVALSGGLYYNVKLNNKILKTIPGKLSVIPLAGDQGAAIGLYYKYNYSFKFKDLLWGKREIENISNYNISHIVNKLKNDEIVQIVCGNMEFGPRALCNTSTLCIPNKENVGLINYINGRNTVMPMAPVILEKNLAEFFEKDQFSRVIGSDRFMIITYDYKNNPGDFYGGAAHKYPMIDRYSGRPQVITDRNSYIYKVLLELDKSNIKMLINTSFNVHGKPIVYSEIDAINDFDYQKQRSKDRNNKPIHLLIGNIWRSNE